MNFINRKDSIARKILIILLITLTFMFSIVPNYKVYADTVEINAEDMPDEGKGIMGSLLKQIIQIIDAIGDVIMGAFNKFMLGAKGFSSAMLSINHAETNTKNEESWLYAGDADPDFDYGSDTIDTSEFLPWVHDKYDVPNLLYSPEAIFTNNIAALDVNFLNPNKYQAISEEDSANKASESAAGGVLRQIISDWYISFRNIAIVGLLSVLIYLGIRIVISSTAGDKAKYKEYLHNWVIALCLVFFIHFIMSGLLMITDKFNNLFESTANEGIIVQAVKPNGGSIKFKTNIIGFIRFNAQSKSMYDAIAYSILYLALVIYTCIFTFMYFKRFLYMAFLTMIAPLVALTYPIDKVGDGKAQAFNMWFKEYIMNLILQPVHLILYVSLISSAMELVKSNIIYALVAMGFMIPAEKLIKKMFGLDGAQTTSGFGSFAAGAATMTGLKHIAAAVGGGKSGKSNNKGDSEDNNNSNDRIRIQDRDFAQSFNGGNNREQQNPRLTNGNLNDQNAQNEQSEQSEQEEQRNTNEQNEERQRMLDDRAVWQGMVDDQNESELNRREAQQEIDNIDDDMRARGFFDEQQDQGGQPEVEPQEQRIIPKKHWKKDLAIKGLKKVGKVAYKGAKIGARGLGAFGGATIGLAAGVATGDMSKALTFMGAGVAAGNVIGKSAGNLPENMIKKGINGIDKIKDYAEDFKYEKEKAQYGIGYASEQSDIRQNERARTKFMNNKAEKEKYEEMAGRISRETGKNVNAKTLMESAFDYKKAGITDDKQIERGLTMETKYNEDRNIHENMVDIVGMTKDYGRDYVLDDKKRSAMQDTIKSKVNGQRNQDKVWELYTETLGFKNLDSKYAMQRNNNENIQAQRTSNNSNARIPRTTNNNNIHTQRNPNTPRPN